MRNKLSRIVIIGIPTYLVANKYIKETTRIIKSNRGVHTDIYVPVESRDLPRHLGNKIDIFI